MIKNEITAAKAISMIKTLTVEQAKEFWDSMERPLSDEQLLAQTKNKLTEVKTFSNLDAGHSKFNPDNTYVKLDTYVSKADLKPGQKIPKWEVSVTVLDENSNRLYRWTYISKEDGKTRIYGKTDDELLASGVGMKAVKGWWARGSANKTNKKIKTAQPRSIDIPQNLTKSVKPKSRELPKSESPVVEKDDTIGLLDEINDLLA